MPRAIWKGTISFGLVTIPVSLMSAVAPRELAFHLLDSADMTPIHNVRVNSHGEEVPWERVIKGYELPDGRWITLTDEDFRSANVTATQTIDVIAAVEASQVPLPFFDTPYHLAPEKPGAKAYALLREVLRSADRIAIGTVIVRSRQHLCALVPQGDLLMLEMLRWPHELRDTGDIAVPGSDLAQLGVTDAEVALAQQLVATIAGDWDPASYTDTYRDDLLALIARKAAGETIEVSEPAPAQAQVVDIAELLKRSVEEARRSRTADAG